MVNEENRPVHLLREVANQLKECQPLVSRLKAHGVTIKLTLQETKALLNYEKLVLANYTAGQWSYLRIASGIQLSGIAALATCLTRFQAQTNS